MVRLIQPKKVLPPSYQQVPLVPIRQGVIFPHTESVLTFGRPASIDGVRQAFSTNRLVCFVTQKDPRVSEPSLADLYEVGTLCHIERILKTNGDMHAFVRGIARIKIISLKQTQPFLLAKVKQLPEIVENSDQVKALHNRLTSEFRRAVNLGKSVDFLIFMKMMGGVSPQELSDVVAYYLDSKTPIKQEILETVIVKDRLTKVLEELSGELRILELEKKITAKTQKKFDKSMREAVLRERKRTIEQELGALGAQIDDDDNIKELRLQIKKANLPAKVARKANKELSRLKNMAPHNPEAGYIRTYLESLTELPWQKHSVNDVSISKARRTLNADHYGLKEVKERIIEYLAVLKLKKEVEKKSSRNSTKSAKTTSQFSNGTSVPTILCFVGPPGVGKTSIGRSISRALGREFVRISLGGIRDEAEIRGHRRTYVGAMPGRIIQGMKQAGTVNPVFMLDEIDKIGNDFRGDPSAALLEALDPEQNNEFSDHYLEVPYDLSNVMFITTCNQLDTIPPALRDRLEVIRFAGYTEDEKLEIAKRFLWSKQLAKNGLANRDIEITSPALSKTIRFYTREAGVRELERNLAKICRKIAVKLTSRKSISAKLSPITSAQISRYLGPAKFSDSQAEKKDEIGMCTGLAWTQAGGEIMFIEVSAMPGKGRLIITGLLGDVMKESSQAAMSYVRSRWRKLKLKKEFYRHIDVHIHVPEGAVKKDGPSAGCAIATAIVSALTNRPVKRQLGMTGEITLRGRVLEIGGVKEKIIAAHRAGLKEIILPRNNKKDLIKGVPRKVRSDLKFHFVTHMDQVLTKAIK